MLRDHLNLLREKLIQSASLVEGMIDKSINGLTEKQEALLLEVIEQDEPKENRIELDIDEACIHLIACYQPHAKDLRSIMMISKMNNDFERMADEAVNISEAALFLIKTKDVETFTTITKMAEEAMKMLTQSLRAFLNEDTEMARRVCEMDDLVDELRDQTLRELLGVMASDPSVIERSLHYIRISRSLERIADLSTNICEDVIYMVEGKTIRHSGVATPQGFK